ncbi:uroporphyrinogen decarboxylase [Coraliomargarita akajimensis]|uniref:Uroporphyrinogen decarboxylase n=1 Tax=Coraliomargarita akajimensis (strain DSM 45221 / IAM 15411 / JCM 23193 / KCTC 12865 / 04OKA010-24) TaxID=583355 RepID=D5ELW2_CORAD|nr:uroporphyrinogen decarboxylase [Coraliomargarita akajimensis]ADE53287.1 uroporphyrinogen decarboxylase [Coraliomargarita akajimensis DSM 45221]
MMTSRQRFLAAAACQPVDRPPIWLMRQAGRYLPEYRELKAQHDFVTMVRTPELAAEVTLQPLKRFPLDAAIIFSDILVIPEALGQGYHFRDQGGIGMDYLLDTAEKIEALDAEKVTERLAYVASALELTKFKMDGDKALLGFCGSPWTLACYMVEGGSAKDFIAIKRMAWDQPELFEKLMQKLTHAIIDYLHMQIDAGADALQIFDSWGSICPAIHYEAWSLRWIHDIINALKGRVPVILYAKGMGHKSPDLLRTGASILSLDWTLNMRRMRKVLGPHVTVQGNLDPVTLTTTPEIVRKEAMRLIDDIGRQPGFIFNLGHGMLPSAKIECVEALMEVVTGQKNA